MLRLLASEQVSLAEIIKVLSEYPFLRKCYSKYAQEGFSLAQLKLFLKENGLQEKIILIDQNNLSNLRLLNQLAYPYFSDIASRKKISHF